MPRLRRFEVGDDVLRRDLLGWHHGVIVERRDDGTCYVRSRSGRIYVEPVERLQRVVIELARRDSGVWVTGS